MFIHTGHSKFFFKFNLWLGYSPYTPMTASIVFLLAVTFSFRCLCESLIVFIGCYGYPFSHYTSGVLDSHAITLLGQRFKAGKAFQTGVS